MNKRTIEMYFGSALHEAYMAPALAQNGMGHVILTRKTVSGMIVGVLFLCDHWCLGVKDCFAIMENPAGYRALLERIQAEEGVEPITPEVAKKYVTDLVAWSRELGFTPAPEYRFCRQILDGITADPNAHFTFGYQGLPMYTNGPHETPSRIREVLRILSAYKARTGNEVHIMLGNLYEPIALPENLMSQATMVIDGDAIA